MTDDPRSILPILVMHIHERHEECISTSSLKIPTILESNDDNVSKHYDLCFHMITMISKRLPHQLLRRETGVTAGPQQEVLAETLHKKS